MMTLKDKTEQIKKQALKCGFDKVGVAIVEPLDKSDFMETWLSRGFHGEMDWMENYLDKRLDVRKLFPGAQSVLMVAHNYYTPQKHSSDSKKAKISRYAWGKDYHKLIKKKLKRLLAKIKEIDPLIEGRVFCDTAPVQEKLWAAKAGLGWQGKHTNLISRDYGSWLFLGGLVINQKLIYDGPHQDYCGSCKACIEACPTQALKPYQLDARRCISYLTIEFWEKPIPQKFAEKMDNWVFGCDICQDVCPWNKNARETNETRYHPNPQNIAPALRELEQLGEDEFKSRFKKSAVFRAKYQNFMRNVKTLIRQQDTSPQL